MISPLLLRTVLICRNCKLPLAPAPGKMFFRPTSTVSSVSIPLTGGYAYACQYGTYGMELLEPLSVHNPRLLQRGS